MGDLGWKSVVRPTRAGSGQGEQRGSATMKVSQSVRRCLEGPALTP